MKEPREWLRCCVIRLCLTSSKLLASIAPLLTPPLLTPSKLSDFVHVCVSLLGPWAETKLQRWPTRKASVATTALALPTRRAPGRRTPVALVGPRSLERRRAPGRRTPVALVAPVAFGGPALVPAPGAPSTFGVQRAQQRFETPDCKPHSERETTHQALKGESG